jgi:hypothetical protein
LEKLEDASDSFKLDQQTYWGRFFFFGDDPNCGGGKGLVEKLSDTQLGQKTATWRNSPMVFLFTAKRPEQSDANKELREVGASG